MKLAILAALVATVTPMKLGLDQKTVAVPTKSFAESDFTSQHIKYFAQSKSKAEVRAMSKLRNFQKLAQQTPALDAAKEDECGCGEELVCWSMCLGDKNGDGVINFDEAKELANSLSGGEPVAEEDVREIFDAFDTDASGDVTPEELVNMFYIYMPIMEAINEFCLDDENCWNDALWFLEQTADHCKDDQKCWENALEGLMGSEDAQVNKDDIVGIRAIYEFEPKRIAGYSGFLGWCTSIDGGEPKPRVNSQQDSIHECAKVCDDDATCLGFQFSPQKDNRCQLRFKPMGFFRQEPAVGDCFWNDQRNHEAVTAWEEKNRD